jgi:hypothetical protein
MILEELSRWGLVAGVGMRAADHQAIHATGGILGHAEADPSAHRVAPEMGLRDAHRIGHRRDIRYPFVERIGTGIMRLVALPVTTRIEQHQSVIALEGIHVPEFVPVVDALREPVLQDERRAFAFDTLVNADALIIGIWHAMPPLTLP